METTVERLDESSAKLTVTLDAAEVDAAVAKAYADVAAKVRIPGFRKGRVPRPVIDTHIGRDAVLAEAQEQLVSESYPRALSDEDLRPVESPKTGDMADVVSGEPYTFTVTVTLRPELELASVDDLSAEVEPATVSDREVDAQIAYTRDRFATLEVVEKGVEPGDFALISFTSTIDGEPYEGDTVDGYLYELGKGLMPLEFDEALIGTQAGGTAVAEFTIPEGSSNPDFVGKPARFEIAVQEVKAKVLPELDDDFATSVGGFESLDEYRADVRSTLEKNKQAGHAQRVEAAVKEALADKTSGEIPELMIRGRVRNLIQDFSEGMQQRGLTLDQYLEITGTDIDDLREDAEKSAERQLRVELALESLFRQKGMAVTDADLEEELSAIAGEKGDLAKTRTGLRDAGALPVVREQIMHRKALQWALDHATIVDKEPEQSETEEEQA